MSGFADIVGQEQIIDHLQNAISMKKISHAYIINGPENSGKMMLAEAFALALQCEEGRPEGCGQCHSCKQAINRNNPDIIYVSHEKPNTLGVKDIRSQLVNDMEIKPYSSKYKIYIVDEAEKMNQEAQNALLKTIEEPPAYGIIMLLTTNADMFLQTIRSRCITLNIKTVKDDIIKDFLMHKHQQTDYQADVCVAFAQGNVGRAIQLASSGDFIEMKKSVIHIITKMENVDLYDLADSVKEISEYKDNLSDYFDLMEIWYRDVLYIKATSDVNGLIFKDQVLDIKKQAVAHSYKGIETIIQSIENAKSRLKANVNFELTLELLLLTIKEN